jgi:hypothetical protein
MTFPCFVVFSILTINQENQRVLAERNGQQKNKGIIN